MWSRRNRGGCRWRGSATTSPSLFQLAVHRGQLQNQILPLPHQRRNFWQGLSLGWCERLPLIHRPLQFLISCLQPLQQFTPRTGALRHLIGSPTGQNS